VLGSILKSVPVTPQLGDPFGMTKAADLGAAVLALVLLTI
jgi:hypothetical protein